MTASPSPLPPFPPVQTPPVAPVHIMLDLETLGTSAGSVVWAIGACAAHWVMGAWEVRTLDLFYALIDVENAGDHGLQIDARTLAWWMKQEPAASVELGKALAGGEGTHPLPEALSNFGFWLDRQTTRWVSADDIPGERSKPLLWGNGADFDPVLLSACYDATTLARPWGPKSARCYRTLKELFPTVTIEDRPGAVKHRADHDALAQMRHLVRLLEAGDEAKEPARPAPIGGKDATEETELMTARQFGSGVGSLNFYGDGWGGFSRENAAEHYPGWWWGPVEKPRFDAEPQTAALDLDDDPVFQAVALPVDAEMFGKAGFYLTSSGEWASCAVIGIARPGYLGIVVNGERHEVPQALVTVGTKAPVPMAPLALSMVTAGPPPPFPA